MDRTVIIEIKNQYLHFSVAHFTIFSATERERLHGHNFSLKAKVKSKVQSNGLAFDYQKLKTCLYQICQSLDEFTLIAQNSPHLIIVEEGDYYAVHFNGEKILLLITDTLLLPITNVSLEELGRFIIEQLRNNESFNRLAIERLEVEVASGPGQGVTSVYPVAGEQ